MNLHNSHYFMSLTPAEIHDLQSCEEIIERGKKTFVEVGLALAEIRERKLYKRDFNTFEAYCQQRWGWSHQRTSQLINSAAVVQRLPEKVATMVAKSERAVREVAKVEPSKREEVIQKAASTGPVTARKIAEAARSVEEKPAIEVDELGQTIPKQLLPMWERREEAQVSMTLCSKLKGVLQAMSKVRDTGDLLYRELDLRGLVADVNRIYQQLECGKPYAVCALCRGLRSTKDCDSCKGRGFVSKFLWDTTVPKEFKDMLLRKREDK